MEERGEGQGGSRCGRSQGSENAVWLEGDRAAGAFRLCLGPGPARSGGGGRPSLEQPRCCWKRQISNKTTVQAVMVIQRMDTPRRDSELDFPGWRKH